MFGAKLRETQGVDSEDTVVIRPRKARRASWIAAVVIVLVFTGLAFALTGPTDRGEAAVFEPADKAAMVVLGLLAAGGVLLFTRPMVRADAQGVHVRNIIGSYDLPWQVVRAVRFERGASWASLELQDDDEVSVMAIQAVDKAEAVAAVRRLRALLARSRGEA